MDIRKRMALVLSYRDITARAHEAQAGRGVGDLNRARAIR